MTTAFIAEVKIEGKVLYVGKKGRLETAPFFWRVNSLYHLKRYLRSESRLSRSAYRASRDTANTTVIRISNLEAGLKGALAEPMTFIAFMYSDWSATPKLNNKNAVYKLKVGDVWVGTTRRCRFGITWGRAGDVRTHMTSMLHYFKNSYKTAVVYEIEYESDGITPRRTIPIPAIEFYCRSPDCRTRYVAEFGEPIIPSSLNNVEATS